MDVHNRFFLGCIAACVAFVGFKAFSEDARDKANAAYRDVCSKGDGVPLIVGQTRLCFSKTSVVSIIPVYAQ
jgi:hypothetical protein